jgi:Zn-dependent protease with chaperone function
MKKRDFFKYFLSLFGLSILSSCTTVPVTNRKQLNIVPDKWIRWVSDKYYYDFLDDNLLIRDLEMYNRVFNIGLKIQNGIKKYFEIKKLDFKKYNLDYEINVVDDQKNLNAFAMANAKVVFFRRIIEFCENDDQIAAIMGHEMGHVIAKHIHERISQRLTWDVLTLGIAELFAQLGFFLPWSRKQESEADYLGVVFMTLSGFDPYQAAKFWENLYSYKEKLKKYKSDSDLIVKIKKNLPEFTSTHPFPKNRAKRIKDWADEVKNEFSEYI